MPKPTWLERFAARLLRLNPELSALDAVQIAQQHYATVSCLDPRRCGGDDLCCPATATSE